MERQTLRVVVADETDESGLMGNGSRARRVITAGVKELREELSGLAESIGETLENVDKDMGGFRLEEVELYGEIDANGKVSVLGSGMEVGALGGLKFVFRRK